MLYKQRRDYCTTSWEKYYNDNRPRSIQRRDKESKNSKP